MARLNFGEVVKWLSEGYRASLEDDGGFAESELVDQLGVDENEVTYDEDNDEFVVSDRVATLFKDAVSR